MNIAANTGGLDKRILSSCDFIQLRLQLAQCLIAEARADVAGVSQLFFFIVKAQQKRTDPYPGALWIGVAADDELLALAALELYPVGGAARDIGRVLAFADHAFQAHATCRSDDIVCWHIKGCAEVYRIR